jgi:hypothetical protein
MEKVRIIVYYKDRTIQDIFEFELKTRKDGLSKPLCDQLWIANQIKPEDGTIEVDFIEGD